MCSLPTCCHKYIKKQRATTTLATHVLLTSWPQGRNLETISGVDLTGVFLRRKMAVIGLLLRGLLLGGGGGWGSLSLACC